MGDSRASSAPMDIDSPSTTSTGGSSSSSSSDRMITGDEKGITFDIKEKTYKEGEFRLSATLSGHAYSVRDIAIASNNCFATAEERGLIHLWDRSSDGKSFTQRTLPLFVKPVHESLVFCCEYIPVSTPASSSEDQGWFWSCGGDFSVRAWNAKGELGPVLFHKDINSPVCSLAITSDKRLVVGSWDGQARIWEQKSNGSWEIKNVLSGHEHAVEVLTLATDEIITGGADKNIYIWRESKIVKKIHKAHDHTIRKLIHHPLGFASAANDGMVKIWSNAGELLVQINAVPESDGPKFIYGLAMLPSGELVSCGEDGAVRIWTAEGKLVQTLKHPGPVRSVKAFSNGDIVTGCADRVSRIFTRHPERQAPAKEIMEYEQMVQLVSSSGMSQMDLASLPTESALLSPGAKDGQILCVNVKNRGAIVYKWVEKQMIWEEVGEALGKAPPKKNLEGQEYDFVTDVFVTDDIKVKLGFNKDEDPMEVATRFCTLHGIPLDYRDQVLKHVEPLVDPVLVKQKKLREKMDADEKALVHVPAWRTAGFHLYTESNIKGMKSKLLQYSAAFKGEEKTKALSLTDDELKVIDPLLENISDVKNFHTNPFPDNQRNLMRKLMTWSNKEIIPVLDMFRVLMCHTDAISKLGRDSNIEKKLLELVSSGNNTHLSLVLKISTNWIAKRNRTGAERENPPKIPPEVNEYLTNVLDSVAVAATSEDPGITLSYVLLLNNVVQWLGRMKMIECDLYAMIVSGLSELLTKKVKDKPLFYSLLVIGSVSYVSESAKGLIKDSMDEQLEKILKDASTHSNEAIRQVARDVNKVLRR